MEARATIKETSVSKAFVAAILVLVAMGLGAMGGYIAAGAGASSTGAQQQVQAHPAPGTVLRQDSSAQPADNASPTGAVRNGTHGDHGNLS